MHTEPELTKCTKCGRVGMKKESGVPAGWRRGVQDQLLCPICWAGTFHFKGYTGPL